jgi:hypothetical protein
MPFQVENIPSNLALYHTNRALTQFAMSYAQDPSDFIADQIAPPIMVNNQSDVYWIGDTEHLRRGNTARAIAGTFSRGRPFRATTDLFACRAYGWEEKIGWEMPVNADAVITPEQENASICVDKLKLEAECQVAEVAQDTDLWPNTEASGYWDNTEMHEAGNPFLDVNVGKLAVRAATGKVPNTVFFNWIALQALYNNPWVLDRLKYTVPGAIIPMDVLLNAFHLGPNGQVLVGTGVVDLTPEGAKDLEGNDVPPNIVDIWGPVCGVAYIDPRVGPFAERILAPMRQFVWTPLGGRFATRTYQEDQSNSTIVQSVDYYDVKQTIGGAMFLLTDILTP